MADRPSAPPPDSKKAKRPWRDNLEAFGIAILFAVLLKPMIIEAYQIPTPSMQPTLMGSTEAGIHDRILVDKQRYEIIEPKRWDIAVFRYPIRRNQNYVKRIVGVPGDRIRIAGGNLYECNDDGDIAGAYRKPDHIQAGLWKEVFPARYLLDQLRGEPKILGEFFDGQIGEWKTDGDEFVGVPSSNGRSRLIFSGFRQDGLSNQVYDGYPTDVADAIRDAAGGDRTEGVQDIRASFEVTASETPAELSIELTLRPAGRDERRMRLVVAGGAARLAIDVDGEERATSESVDCPLAAGESVHLSFAQIDDRLVGWIDGDEVLTLEVGEHRVASELSTRAVTLAVEAKGGGTLRYADFVVERDLHYTPSGLGDALDLLVPEGKDLSLLHHVIEVPEGHYLMMGDNTLRSADARQWKTFTVAVNDKGWMVDPESHPDARVVTGNRRPWPLSSRPDNDENPVIVRSNDVNRADRVVMTDDNGEVFALLGKIAPGYSEQGMQFVDTDGNGARTWEPEEKHVFFVPREHILGRPMVTFWPPSRIGIIR